MAVAHHSKLSIHIGIGARCGLHWHDHRMVVGHGNSVLIVKFARSVSKATEAGGPRCKLNSS